MNCSESLNPSQTSPNDFNNSWQKQLEEHLLVAAN